MSDKNITALNGIGEKRAQLFNKLGVFSVDDLLYNYPRDYVDMSSPYSPADAPFGEPCAVRATVIKPVVETRIRKGMTLYKFTAGADGAALKVTVFNNRFIKDKIKVGEEYIFYGSVAGRLYDREMSSPDILDSGKSYIRPIYHATAGLPSYIIENAVRQALSEADTLPDPIPLSVREKYRLPGIADAIKAIHFPENMNQLKSARRRLMFQEMLVLQCGLAYLGSAGQREAAVKLGRDYTDEFCALLPFDLTEGQKSAVADAMKDMRSGRQMNRLLQGDVGSGKTAVAACLSYSTAKNGYQSAIMAPTEILAEQHFASLSKMFDGTEVTCALLTGSTPAKQRRETLSQLKSGEIDVLIGTHAIITGDVEFGSLALVITDEQHRFGVKQRSRLVTKADAPHTLVMSATPIPRTLALLLYSDLDISVPNTVPAGRKPVETRLITSEKLPLAYDFIKRQLDKGRQAYIVCPLVEESENSDPDLKSAAEYYDELSVGEFKGYVIGLLHGKMRSKDKDAVMRRFAEGEIQLLISTTVIEVGVDVPNSTMMMIMNAERFGLSQLHQLRGRVGRGSHRSYCVLVSDSKSTTSAERLDVMCRTNNGFEISEFDLQQRGPGDFFGNRQHGLPNLRLSNMMSDCEALAFSQSVAKAILERDPRLESGENEVLRSFVKKMFSEVEGGLN